MLLTKKASRFNEIGVYETSELYGRTGKYRILQFADGAVQGAMDMKEPQRVVLEYQRAIIHLMDWNDPDFRSAFLIGHGTGTIAGHYPGKPFVVAEIDEMVVELSREYFGYRPHNVLIGDGRELLEEQMPNAFDYIILDAFTSKGTPMHLTTLEFFQTVMDKLRSGGAIILNLAGKLRNDRLSSAIHTTLSETCAYTRVFFLPVNGAGMDDSGNMIMIGSNRPIQAQSGLTAGFAEIEMEQGHMIRDSKQHNV
ncbi:spermidine synthase [Paenibacillus kobensis]|uniref:spermidine synthase n=1 Tax=Paenibacillus kobensis TaxID=59841 RepID=UPI000FDC255E|nr:fused MFS/spermidine synthase [Paenibacillus kobensis]